MNRSVTSLNLLPTVAPEKSETVLFVPGLMERAHGVRDGGASMTKHDCAGRDDAAMKKHLIRRLSSRVFVMERYAHGR